MTDTAYDPRITPARPDLAAAHLAGQVKAERFVAGETFTVRAAIAPLRPEPSTDAVQVSELLIGHRLTVYETKDGWAWGQVGHDHYVGYVNAEALAPATAAPTHRVRALASHMYAEPDLKSRPLLRISMGSRLCLDPAGAENGFFPVADGGWIFARHVTPKDRPEPDAVATAVRLIGVPYLWGGASSFGLDCSGLVQLVLAMAGIEVARDSDQQARSIGAPVAPIPAPGSLRRGDLVFFPGHVGIMRDAHRLIHANARAMMVSCEPLAEVIARIARTETQPLTTVRRLD